MSEHTPEYRNFRGPFFIRDCPGRREIRCESGRYIAESAKSGAPGIDAELAKVIRQMAAAPLLVEAAEEFRDCVLNERHHLEDAGLDNDQINAVLGLFDDTFSAALQQAEGGEDA